MSKKKKFDAKKESEALVAKYVTSRTHLNTVWHSLYDFAEYLVRLGYKAGRASKKS